MSIYVLCAVCYLYTVGGSDYLDFGAGVYLADQFAVEAELQDWGDVTYTQVSFRWYF